MIPANIDRCRYYR